MKFSLLSKQFIDNTIDTSLVYNLSIDRTLSYFSDNSRKNEYFATVLCNIPKDKEEIFRRREVICDFTETENLFADVRAIFRRYDKLKSDWMELKGNAGPALSDKGNEAALEYCYSSLKVTSLFPKTIDSFFGSIYEILSSYPIKSRALTEIRDYCKETVNSEAFSRLCEIAASFSYNKVSDYDFSVITELSDLLYLSECEISAINKREEKKKNIFDKFKVHKSEDDIIFSTENEVAEDGEYILCEALLRIDDLLEQITDKVYDSFYGLSLELDFYEVAMSYCDFLKNHGIENCYPEISSDRLDFDELKDLFLLCGQDKVYPNSFRLDCGNGAVIKGKNNTGKTTFLRSVGSAVLFSYAGLPIPCKSACVVLYSNIFSHFSSAEESFESGDSSGRFEGEVKAVSEIVNSLESNSLILLNETFQTTSYDEGSLGISPVLRVFIKENCNFIFITHLSDLFSGDDEKIIKYESKEDEFKIIPIEAKTK